MAKSPVTVSVRPRPGFIFLAALTLCVSATNAAAQQPWDRDVFSGNPKAILAAAEAAVKGDEKGAVVLLDERRIVLDAASRAVETRRLVYWIGQEAPGEWSNVEAVWRPWLQERPSVRARVITNAAREVELERNALSESPLGTFDVDTFSDTLVLRAPLPAIAAGAVVETQVVTRDTRPFLEGGISTYIPLGHSIPALQTRIIVEAPASLPLKHALRFVPGVEPVRLTSGNRTTVTFEVGRMEAIDDLAFLFGAGPDTQPYAAFSTAASWNDVATAFSKVVESRLAKSDVNAIVKQALAGVSGRDEIIETLLQLVQRRIRYKAVQLGDAAIVPTPPSETLRLEYGDCKDQAALLIAMLRTAGIEAHMALLSVSGIDAAQELPGFGAFDHAIVYVPGENPIWLDSTAGFSRARQLPSQDEGRMALVAWPGVNSLERIPESKTRIVETREVFLPEIGAGRIVETTEYHGAAEIAQRSLYSELTDTEIRESIQEYAKAAYAAEAVDAIGHTDPADMSVPFRLTFEAKETGIALASLGEAAVAISLWPFVEEIAFLEFPDEPEDRNPEREETGVIVDDVLKEWRYRIVPPAGFRRNEMPENKTERIGPATLSWEFSASNDGSITGLFRFDTARRRYSRQEAEEARKALEEFDENSTLLVTFEHIGEAHLSAGRVLESLTEFRRLAELHPREALHTSRIARALLAGGLGESARAEARRAVELQPDSMVAHQILGIVMEHDLIGRRFGDGWDREAAAAAYRKALEVEPGEVVNHINLGALLEHNADGERYAPGADLDQAIEQYRLGLSKTADGDMKSLLQDNLSVALMWAGRFKEVRETAVRMEFRLAATALLEGADAAVREAGRTVLDSLQRQAALLQAGNVLSQMRHYDTASEMMRAAARGSSNASEILARAEQVARVKRYESVELSESDPASVLKRAVIGVLQRKPNEEIRALVVSGDDESLEALGRSLRSTMQTAAPSAGNILAAVSTDLLVSAAEMTSEGDDVTGYRMSMRIPGGGPVERAYVVRRDGEYRLLTFGQAPSALAMEALRQVEQGEVAAARKLMEWAREAIRPGTSETSRAMLDAVMMQMPRPGESPGAEAIRAAAASALVTSVDTAAIALPILDAAQESADERRRGAIDIARAAALFTLERYEESLDVARSLMSRSSNIVARNLAFAGLLRLGRLGEARDILNAPPPVPADSLVVDVRAILGGSIDLDKSRRLASLEIITGNFAAAESLLRQITADRGAQAGDYNNLAWLSLFRDKVTEDDISGALRAAQQDRSRPSLHTLAALYAETGQIAEALQVIYQSIAANGGRGVESADWYVFGRIYEHLGERDAAITAYNRVQAPNQKPEDPTSTYVQAQRRLASLQVR